MISVRPRAYIALLSGTGMNVLDDYDEVAQAWEDADGAHEMLRLVAWQEHGRHGRVAIPVGAVLAIHEVTDEQWHAYEIQRAAAAQQPQSVGVPLRG